MTELTQRLPLLDSENVMNSLDLQIDKGDCGIVLKPDGSFRVFSTGMEELTPATMTDAQRQQGVKMLALSLALRSERIMGMLYEMLNDPDIVDVSDTPQSRQ